MPDTDDLITQTEAAELRDSTVAAINELVRRGRLRSIERFGKTLVFRSEVTAYQPSKGGRPPKSPAETTRHLNKAFRAAKEAEEASQMTKAEKAALKAEAPPQASTKKTAKKAGKK